MRRKDEETSATNKVQATTPPIAPTEPAPIPIPPPAIDLREDEKLNTRVNDFKGEQSPNKQGVPKYYCPMHCEGDKLYDQPGNCPVCGMHLVELKTDM